MGDIQLSFHDRGCILGPRKITACADSEVSGRRFQPQWPQSLPVSSSLYRFLCRPHEGSTSTSMAREICVCDKWQLLRRLHSMKTVIDHRLFYLISSSTFNLNSSFERLQKEFVILSTFHQEVFHIYIMEFLYVVPLGYLWPKVYLGEESLPLMKEKKRGNLEVKTSLLLFWLGRIVLVKFKKKKNSRLLFWSHPFPCYWK